SRSHLYRLFQRYGGVSAYILRLRLRQAAAELVRNPGRAITEIAYGLGFNSPSDFSRAFRRAYGYSPSDVRMQLAKGMAQSSHTVDQFSTRPNRPYWDWFGNPSMCEPQE
nr:AraC family transcriptional regulator [Pseudomonas sp.]